MTDLDPATYLVALSELRGVGRRTAIAVVSRFPTADALLAASRPALGAAVGERVAELLVDRLRWQWPDAVVEAKRIAERHRERGFYLCGFQDPLYPRLLRLIDDPPAMLFVRGDVAVLDSARVVAVVGTRSPTIRGEETARRVARRFAETGAVVVSGLAHGIDTAAHLGALQAGSTIAVLGTAIDKVYPAENKRLAAEIAEHGALVSEYPIGYQSRGAAFVERDRIQAGLSVAVVPVQTGLVGGTRHTISFAQKAGRRLLCPPVPPVEGGRPEYEGIVDLISRGVATVFTGDDLPGLLSELDQLRSTLLGAKPGSGSVPAASRRKRGVALAEGQTLLLPTSMMDGNTMVDPGQAGVPHGITVSGHPRSPANGSGAWELAPGERIRRVDLHDRFGGNRQGGIARSRTTGNVFIFTDPRSGARHGYFDSWIGDVLRYTGEGQLGDQRMIGGNKAILEHKERSEKLRLFQGVRGVVRYLGEYELDEPPWSTGYAPETNEGPIRKVVQFNLRPAGRAPRMESFGAPYEAANEAPTSATPQPFAPDATLVDRGRAGHARTQNALAAGLRAAGLMPRCPAPGDADFDLAWRRGETVFVAEIKSLTPANEASQLRVALGQVLDYQDLLLAAGHRDVRAVIAVEREPADGRWVALCQRHGVTLVWPETFDVLLGSLS